MTVERRNVRAERTPTLTSTWAVVGDVARLTSAAVALLWRARRAPRRTAARHDGRGLAVPDPIRDGVHLGRARSSSG